MMLIITSSPLAAALKHSLKHKGENIYQLDEVKSKTNIVWQLLSSVIRKGIFNLPYVIKKKTKQKNSVANLLVPPFCKG